jgi:hypothetical protein
LQPGKSAIDEVHRGTVDPSIRMHGTHLETGFTFETPGAGIITIKEWKIHTRRCGKAMRSKPTSKFRWIAARVGDGIRTLDRGIVRDPEITELINP